VTIHEWTSVPKVLARFAQREYMTEAMSSFWSELHQFVAEGLSLPEEVLAQRRQEFEEREQKREEWAQRALLLQQQGDQEQQEEEKPKPKEKGKSMILFQSTNIIETAEKGKAPKETPQQVFEEPNLVQNRNLLVDRLNFLLVRFRDAYPEFIKVC
jgi:hypothetical protein